MDTPGSRILIKQILGFPYADWMALMDVLREHYNVRSPAEGATVVRRQAEALGRMKKCNARQNDEIQRLKARLETTPE